MDRVCGGVESDRRRARLRIQDVGRVRCADDRFSDRTYGSRNSKWQYD